MMKDSEDDRWAFNDGCQARIEGKPVTALPDYGGSARRRFYWRLGYADVNNHWGEEARVIPAARLAALRVG
jgi:hypothetical protein